MPEYVTLHFQVSFLKSQIVVAPDGTAHPLTIKCIKPNATLHEYPPVEIGPLGKPDHSANTDDTCDPDDKYTMLAEASRRRALLGAAVALFDAELAEMLAGLAGLPPPTLPEEQLAC